MSIVELEERIAGLPPEARAAADRIFAVSATTGTLVPPDEMRPWIEKQFGSVESVVAQRIVRVTDLVTLEGALFNEIRARRPMSVPEKSGAEVAETIRSTENDPFRLPVIVLPPPSASVNCPCITLPGLRDSSTWIEPLSGVAAAFQALDSGEAMKILVDCGRN